MLLLFVYYQFKQTFSVLGSINPFVVQILGRGLSGDSRRAMIGVPKLVEAIQRQEEQVASNCMTVSNVANWSCLGSRTIKPIPFIYFSNPEPTTIELLHFNEWT